MPAMHFEHISAYARRMSELTLAGLGVVLEVARTGSFSAAAERLGYTQSAVSRQVAVTEKAVGAPLFERHARGVRLTAAGEVLVRHAGKVLDGVAAASQELAGLRDRLAGRLVVGGFPTATAALLPRAVARLLTDHPGLRVQLMEASTPAQLRALRRGRLEVAILATARACRPTTSTACTCASSAQAGTQGSPCPNRIPSPFATGSIRRSWPGRPGWSGPATGSHLSSAPGQASPSLRCRSPSVIGQHA